MLCVRKYTRQYIDDCRARVAALRARFCKLHDRLTYFERCWPNRRNTDFFRIEGGKVSEVRVFYGLPPKVAQPSIERTHFGPRSPRSVHVKR
jgi:hypothetical protein